MYGARHYIYFFVFAYGYLLTDAGYHIYYEHGYHPAGEGTTSAGINQSDGSKSIWENIHFGLCFVLFAISGTTPHPIHPLDLNEQLNSKVYI